MVIGKISTDATHRAVTRRYLRFLSVVLVDFSFSVYMSQKYSSFSLLVAKDHWYMPTKVLSFSNFGRLYYYYTRLTASFPGQPG